MGCVNFGKFWEIGIETAFHKFYVGVGKNFRRNGFELGRIARKGSPTEGGSKMHVALVYGVALKRANLWEGLANGFHGGGVGRWAFFASS
jgi:hypothetical protein